MSLRPTSRTESYSLATMVAVLDALPQSDDVRLAGRVAARELELLRDLREYVTDTTVIASFTMRLHPEAADLPRASWVTVEEGNVEGRKFFTVRVDGDLVTWPNFGAVYRFPEPAIAHALTFAGWNPLGLANFTTDQLRKSAIELPKEHA